MRRAWHFAWLRVGGLHVAMGAHVTVPSGRLIVTNCWLGTLGYMDITVCIRALDATKQSRTVLPCLCLARHISCHAPSSSLSQVTRYQHRTTMPILQICSTHLYPSCGTKRCDREGSRLVPCTWSSTKPVVGLAFPIQGNPMTFPYNTLCI